MFKGTLFTIQEIIPSDRGHCIKVQLNPEHHIFEGHFPEQPIVPGVCTLQIIKECVEEIMDKPLIYSSISSCKFTSMILPSTDIIEITVNLNDTLLTASVSSNGNVVLKLKANLLG